MEHLDLRNIINPFGLLKASNTFRSLKAGEELEILCNDRKTIIELFKVIPSGVCELVSMTDLDGAQPGLRTRLRKLNP